MADQAAALEELSALVSRHDISQAIVTDVLHHCDQDAFQAVQLLSEMFENNTTHENQSISLGTTLPIKSFSPADSSSLTTQGPSPVNPIPPRGAWAQKPIALNYRISEMCNRYQWATRDLVESLFVAYGDCQQLVEEQLLQMFPVDEPIAFGSTPQTSFPSNAKSIQQGSNTQNNIARRQQTQALRQQVENELRLEATKGGPPPLSNEELTNLRQTLWNTRSYRQRLQMLASQTRKPEHYADVREQDVKLSQLSEAYLQALQRSSQFREGLIDVHGLTKEEAIQLVEAKLEETGKKRFRVITGKGTHSHRGQAVLKPALERYLRSKGIACSLFEDGILTVNP